MGDPRDRFDGSPISPRARVWTTFDRCFTDIPTRNSTAAIFAARWAKRAATIAVSATRRGVAVADGASVTASCCDTASGRAQLLIIGQELAIARPNSWSGRE
jgi:hypothetical protein